MVLATDEEQEHGDGRQVCSSTGDGGGGVVNHGALINMSKSRARCFGNKPHRQ